MLTFSPPIVAWWDKFGFKAALRYTIDALDYWEIDVPPDNEHMKDEEYLKLIEGEKAAYMAVLYRRFRPPMFTVESRHRIAVTMNKAGENCLALARDKRTLQKVFLRPDKGQVPRFKHLKRPNQIRNVLKQMHQGGIKQILWFFGDNGENAEAFSVRMALSFFDPAAAQETHGVKAHEHVEPAHEVAQRNAEVQPVQAASGLPAGSAGGGTPEHVPDVSSGSAGGN